MLNANKGYVGWSMSVRAAEAYENDEMPRSKWTKKAMLERIASYCWLCDLECDEAIAKLPKDELFRRFFFLSSWHHTGKLFNETDFYALDEQAIEEFCNQPTVRAYKVIFSINGKRYTSRRTFATMTKAKRYLEDNGWKRGKYSYERGGNFASVNYDEIAI